MFEVELDKYSLTKDEIELDNDVSDTRASETWDVTRDRRITRILPDRGGQNETTDTERRRSYIVTGPSRTMSKTSS